MFELCLGNVEMVWCQGPAMGEDQGSSQDDVVCDSVGRCRCHIDGFRQCWKLMKHSSIDTLVGLHYVDAGEAYQGRQGVGAGQ